MYMQQAKTISPGPLLAGGLALVAALASTQTWARAFFVTVSGTETDRGLVTLVAGLICAATCFLRAFSTVRDKYYFGLGILLAAVAFAMPAWLIYDIQSAETADVFGKEVHVVQASMGVWMAAGSAGALLASLLWQWCNPAPVQSTLSAPEPVSMVEASQLAMLSTDSKDQLTTLRALYVLRERGILSAEDFEKRSREVVSQQPAS